MDNKAGQFVSPRQFPRNYPMVLGVHKESLCKHRLCKTDRDEGEDLRSWSDRLMSCRRAPRLHSSQTQLSRWARDNKMQVSACGYRCYRSPQIGGKSWVLRLVHTRTRFSAPKVEIICLRNGECPNSCYRSGLVCTPRLDVILIAGMILVRGVAKRFIHVLTHKDNYMQSRGASS